MLWEISTKIANLLGETRCYYFGGAFHVSLDAEGDWTLALRPDSAGRLRVDTCHLGRIRGTRWGKMDDDARLAAIVHEAQADALERA